MEQAGHDAGAVEAPEASPAPHVVVAPIPRERVSELWSYLRPFVLQALEHSHGETTDEHVLVALLSGQTHALVVLEDGFIRGVFLVGTVAFPAGEALRVTHGACELPSELWLDQLVDSLDEGARNMGARWIQVFGRRGFEKLLAPFSNHSYTVMVRDVPDG